MPWTLPPSTRWRRSASLSRGRPALAWCSQRPVDTGAEQDGEAETEQDRRDPLAAQRLDDRVGRVPADQHQHEQEQHHDRAGVHDDLHEPDERAGLQDVEDTERQHRQRPGTAPSGSRCGPAPCRWRRSARDGVRIQKTHASPADTCVARSSKHCTRSSCASGSVFRTRARARVRRAHRRSSPSRCRPAASRAAAAPCPAAAARAAAPS